MDYEKKYKEFLEKAQKELQACGSTDCDAAKQIFRFFPELNKSEDNMIKEELIKHLKDGVEGYMPAGGSEDYARWLAWVEKQGEQKPTDKIESKFHEDEWVSNGDYTWKIIEVTSLDYILQSQDGNIVDDTISHVDEQFHSFSIEDAKDGDVLYSHEHNLLWIYKNKEECHVAINLNYTNSISFGTDIVIPSDICPATKEQRDLLFQKMKEAGYEWSEETHELKKISQRTISAEAKEALYDKPTDEEMKELLRTEYEKGRADTIAEMKSSWSEEDVKKIDRAIWLIEHDASHGWIKELREDVISGLKSLKQKIKL